MPYYGASLKAPVPTDIPIWPWLFDSKYARLPRPHPDQKGGFRDGLTNEFLSYDDIKDLSTFLATGMARKYGVGAGTNVAVFASNSIYYPVAMFATIRIGAVFTGSSPDYGVEEATHILRASSAKLVYADQGSLKVISTAASKLGIPIDRIVLLDKSTSNHLSVKDLIAEGRKSGSNQTPAWAIPTNQTNKTALGFLSFTSGTTSLPKGVMISHHNFIAQMLQMASLGRNPLPKTVLSVLPLFHITGLVQLMQLPVVLNQVVVIMAKFDMTSMLATISRHRCDELWLVPPLLIRLINDPAAREADFSHVIQFNTGAAPMAKEIADKLAKLYPKIAIRQAWGMTESTSALTLTPPELQKYELAHTVGKVVPETVLKIIDPETGKEVAEGEVGEVWAKGPQVTMGYLNNPTATAETYDAEGFLHTGDIGSMDSEGILTIQDRLKEMIKVKGIALAPAELEDLLLGHPAVADAAVIGVPDAYAGELPKAFVVTKAGTKNDQAMVDDIVGFVKSRRSRHKWLAGGVEFLEAVPKSASGKILRRQLRDREKERLRREGAKL